MGRRHSTTWEAYLPLIIDEYRAGERIKDIAASYNISDRTVSKWLEEAGVKHKRGTPYPLDMKIRARDLYLEGYPSKEIAMMLGVHASNVSRWLKDMGYDPRARRARKAVANPDDNPKKHLRGKKWTEEEKKSVFEMIRAGSAPRDIFYQTGASRKRQRMIKSELEV